jgi:acetyltransferase-like isoleucine patch superfamily enzyme
LREPQPVAIQSALEDPRSSAVSKYQDLVIGSRSLGRLVLHESVVLATSWVPGALGLVLRRVAYPWLLGSVGRNVTFGHGVVLRHPHKVHLGDDVVVDDLVVLDAKGTTNRGISLGDGVFLGRGTILSCKDGDITLGDHVNIGFHSEIFSGSAVTVGRHGLFAAYTYLVGGGHEFEKAGAAVIDQPRLSRGITLGENVWLGAGAKVMDGVTIGDHVVVGAGAVVTGDLPAGAVAVGVPARVVRTREAAPAP